MQQRRLRLGDILDDYCPRERRITNHAVVAMIEDEVKQTRCTTCDADHEYKQAKVPAPRRKKPEASLVAGTQGGGVCASARARSRTACRRRGADRRADRSPRRSVAGSGRRRAGSGRPIAEPGEPEPEPTSEPDAESTNRTSAGASAADSRDAAAARGPGARAQGAGVHDSSDRRPVRRRSETATTVIAGQRQAHGPVGRPAAIRQPALRRSGPRAVGSGHGQRQGNRPGPIGRRRAARRRPAGARAAAAAPVGRRRTEAQAARSHVTSA